VKYRKTNEIINDHGEWLEIDVSTNYFPDTIMKIDKSDWESLSKKCGRFGASKAKHTTYVIGYINGKQLRVQRLLLPDSIVVDHINHDGLDNRRENIRSCTNSQNLMNKRITSKNKSGFVGVAWRERDKMWRAHIGFNGKYIHLGHFKNIEDAVCARKEAEVKYFGEFAPRLG
jgi:hypothetical protein